MAKKVLKFWAPWCGPCKRLSETFASTEINVEVKEINVDDNPDIASDFSIRGIPTLILLDDRTEISRITGVLSSEELLRFINQ